MDELADASDAALVIAIGRYREDALAELFRRHCGAVFALGRRLLASDSLADDLVQDVFMRLWDAPERYDPQRGSVRAFLLAIGHNRGVDLIRADQSRRHRETRQGELAAPLRGKDLDEEVWDLTLADRVAEALHALPVGERDAIDLAYFGGHTYREVAVLLGAPEGTIKSRIRSGLLRLRDDLADTLMHDPWSS